MAYVTKRDTDGTKGLLTKGELALDDYPAGGDQGRLYVGDGTSNIPLAKKEEVEQVYVDIANTYYNKVELDEGQLDTRYYTEAELDEGQLDTRYYTEAEVDNLLTQANTNAIVYAIALG